MTRFMTRMSLLKIGFHFNNNSKSARGKKLVDLQVGSRGAIIAPEFYPSCLFVKMWCTNHCHSGIHYHSWAILSIFSQFCTHYVFTILSACILRKVLFVGNRLSISISMGYILFWSRLCCREKDYIDRTERALDMGWTLKICRNLGIHYCHVTSIHCYIRT